MQKEFYKLILVFIMIMLAFYLAFFLGRELTLYEQENQKTAQTKTPNKFTEETTHTSPQTPLPENPLNNEPTLEENQDQRQKVKEYKKLLPPSNNEQVSQLESQKSTTTSSSSRIESEHKKSEIYGLLVAQYKDRDAAIDKSSHLKVRFPNWDIFFKLSDDVYKVYIGPFREKKSAERFLKNLDKKEEFKEVRLENITSSD